jgi:nucleotidyltransferase/DNA polymerase involved in DNA repair
MAYIIKDKDITSIWFDMQSFYAACELNRHPEIAAMEQVGEKGLLVVNFSGNGFIDALSPNAKNLYVHGRKASRKTRLAEVKNDPRFIMLPADLNHYQAESKRMFSRIEFLRHEGYLPKQEFVDDFSLHLIGDMVSAQSLAVRVKDIYESEGYNLRFGVAINRKYAWMASRSAKVGGQHVFDWPYIKENVWGLELYDSIH